MPPTVATIKPLGHFTPPLHARAWSSTPHPSLPLIATTHDKAVTVYSLSTLSKHSAVTGGHSRSVRCVAWQPSRSTNKLRLVTGSFDATAGLWSWDQSSKGQNALEREVTADSEASDGVSDQDEEDWEFNLVLEGHENEVKSLAFSPGGAFLATSSRDKTVWIWEDVGGGDEDEQDEWETVAVLQDHDGDVKTVAWCPDVPGRKARGGIYSPDVLASASYDNTVRIWREDTDGEWVCVAVLEGHKGTVWGVAWEGRDRGEDKFPRIMTWSADGEVWVWRLKPQANESEQDGGAGGFGAFGGIPNTMRRSIREEWEVESVLPKVHTRDVYSATWSSESGLVATTGSDGIIAIYGEVEEDVPSKSQARIAVNGTTSGSWRVLGQVGDAHGEYEVNHITWCKRFDPGAGENRGKEEMLVTTGDDGTVRPWEVRIS